MSRRTDVDHLRDIEEAAEKGPAIHGRYVV